MSSLDKTIDMAFLFIISIILSAIFDLYDILANGLLFNNNANKGFMLLLIFSSFVLIFEGKNDHHKFFSHCKIVFGLLLLFFAFTDLFINSILDFKKLNFSLILLIKPIGYSIGTIIPLLILCNIRK